MTRKKGSWARVEVSVGREIRESWESVAKREGMTLSAFVRHTVSMRCIELDRRERRRRGLS